MKIQGGSDAIPDRSIGDDDEEVGWKGRSTTQPLRRATPTRRWFVSVVSAVEEGGQR
jgi:hypothetical protein